MKNLREIELIEKIKKEKCVTFNTREKLLKQLSGN